MLSLTRYKVRTGVSQFNNGPRPFRCGLSYIGLSDLLWSVYVPNLRSVASLVSETGKAIQNLQNRLVSVVRGHADFPIPRVFGVPVEVTTVEFHQALWLDRTRVSLCSANCVIIAFSRFDTIPERDRLKDGQTKFLYRYRAVLC